MASRLTKEAIVLGSDGVIVVPCPAVLADPLLQTVSPEGAQRRRLVVLVQEVIQLCVHAVHIHLCAQHAQRQWGGQHPHLANLSGTETEVRHRQIRVAHTERHKDRCQAKIDLSGTNTAVRRR